MTQPTISDREKFWKELDARIDAVHSDEKLMKLKAAKARQNSSLFKRRSFPRKPNV